MSRTSKKFQSPLKRLQSFFAKKIVYIISTFVSIFLVATMTHGATTIGLNISTDGNTTLGSSSSNTLTVNALVASSLTPSTNAARDLGAYGTAWRDLYSSGTVRLGDVNNASSTYNATFLGFNGAATIDTGSTLSLNTLSNSAVSVGAVLRPSAAGRFSLGADGTGWGTIYSSGTILVSGGADNIVLQTKTGTAILEIFGDTGSSNPDPLGVNVLGSSKWYGFHSTKDLFLASGGGASGTGRIYLNNVAGTPDVISTNLLPLQNNTYDLGSATSTAWRNIYASTSLNVSSGGNSSTISGNGNILTTGNYLFAVVNSSNVGALGTGLKNLFASTSLNVSSGAGSSTISGNGNITLTGNVLPASVNASDLAAMGNAFRTLYASTSLNVSSGAASATLASGNLMLTGNILPSAVNSSDLAALGNAFRTLYASTSLNASSGAGSSTVSSNGNLTLTGNILPASVNASDVGALGNAFRNMYASTSLTVSSGGASATISASGNILASGHHLPAAVNSSDIGAMGNAFRDLYASSSLNVSNGAASATISGSGNILFSGKLLPATNNTSDLGSSSGTAFRTIYASSGLYVGGMTASNTIDLRTQPLGVTGRGTCLTLTGTDGVSYFLSVTGTPSAGLPAGSLAISTTSCQ